MRGQNDIQRAYLSRIATTYVGTVKRWHATPAVVTRVFSATDAGGTGTDAQARGIPNGPPRARYPGASGVLQANAFGLIY